MFAFIARLNNGKGKHSHRISVLRLFVSTAGEPALLFTLSPIAPRPVSFDSATFLANNGRLRDLRASCARDHLNHPIPDCRSVCVINECRPFPSPTGLQLSKPSKTVRPKTLAKSGGQFPYQKLVFRPARSALHVCLPTAPYFHPDRTEPRSRVEVATYRVTTAGLINGRSVLQPV